MNKKAFSTYYTMIFFMLFMMICFAFAKNVINSARIATLTLQSAKVFYLAESGIEYAKSKIVSDNNWHTDNTTIIEDKSYLLLNANGQIITIKNGGFKIIRAKDKNIIYSIGFLGNEMLLSPSYSFQKCVFSLPMKSVKWEEL